MTIYYLQAGAELALAQLKLFRLMTIFPHSEWLEFSESLCQPASSQGARGTSSLFVGSILHFCLILYVKTGLTSSNFHLNSSVSCFPLLTSFTALPPGFPGQWFCMLVYLSPPASYYHQDVQLPKLMIILSINRILVQAIHSINIKQYTILLFLLDHDHILFLLVDHVKALYLIDLHQFEQIW